MKKIALILIAVILILTGIFFTVSYSTKNSLPGDSGYKTKTGLVEKIMSFTHFSDSSKVDFGVSLLHNRLNELVSIYNKNEEVSSSTLQTIVDLADTQLSSTLSVLENSPAISSEAKMQLVIDITQITSSMEILAKTSANFSSIKEQTKDLNSKSYELVKPIIDEFIADDPEQADVYLGSLIEEVGLKLQDTAFGSDAQKKAISRVNDANESIIDNKKDEAIFYFLRALEAIAVDSNLWASERGPVEGYVHEEMPMPEGS